MAENTYPPRLRRAESFLGIHFDFHAGDDCTEVGKNVTREMVERVIDQVRPDYIQCDCKGHRGLSSYLTRVGYQAPGFVQDPLRIWRQVTAERGVALFMHYSGVWDNEAVAHHPEWARLDAEGQPDGKNTSVFGAYADQLLIPQLIELAEEYGVDGVWVDGECWATAPDWREEAVAAFRAETGIEEVPRTPEEPRYFEFLQFCREGFRRYLRHYVDAVHARCPRFQIASNWAFTSFMPEPVSAEVDYLSGDYSMQDSVNTARLESRCLVHQGKPWDLMAWSFSSKWGEGCTSTKSVAQLQQEAAVVLSVGGGFQAYFKQKRDGSIYDWTMKPMAETARFCRERQRVCHRARPVPQIGLILAGAACYRKSQRLFGAWGSDLVPLAGVLNALLDSQYSVEIVMEHHLAGRMQEYPLLVLPEEEYLDPAFRGELLSYVEGGGNLLLIGPKAAALFAAEMGIALEGELAERAQWLDVGGWLGGVKSLWQKAALSEKAHPFGRVFPENDPKSPVEAPAAIAPYGRGQIAATFLNLGERYRHAATPTTRDFLASLVHELFPRPKVEVTGSHTVDVAVNRIEGKAETSAAPLLAVNLVNTAGPHANTGVYVFDEVPPVGPLALTIRTGEKPKRVSLEPAGTDLPYTFADGEVRLTLPRLEIHEVIVVA